jgi:hypothetical protein
VFALFQVQDIVREGGKSTNEQNIKQSVVNFLTANECSSKNLKFRITISSVVLSTLQSSSILKMIFLTLNNKGHYTVASMFVFSSIFFADRN